VLIYLSPDQVESFLGRIANTLDPANTVFVGAAETIWQVSDRFKAVHVDTRSSTARGKPRLPRRGSHPHPSIEPRRAARTPGSSHDYLKKPFEAAELLAHVGAALQVKKLQDELQQRNAELDELSRTDALTGLYNRRHLDQELARRHGDAVRHDEYLCLLLFDLDHFKHVNDTFGHPAGDVVIRTFADRLRAELRVGDIGGQWGGEEFLIILPRTDLEGALAVGERICSVTAAEPITAAGQQINVTVSGGCALGPADSAETLVQLVDTCLYQAKLGGRNQIVTASAPGSI
jgi:two-component system cell cycle response regulator